MTTLPDERLPQALPVEALCQVLGSPFAQMGACFHAAQTQTLGKVMTGVEQAVPEKFWVAYHHCCFGVVLHAILTRTINREMIVLAANLPEDLCGMYPTLRMLAGVAEDETDFNAINDLAYEDLMADIAPRIA